MKYVHFCRRIIVSMESQNKRTMLDFERRFQSKYMFSAYLVYSVGIGTRPSSSYWPGPSESDSPLRRPPWPPPPRRDRCWRSTWPPTLGSSLCRAAFQLSRNRQTKAYLCYSHTCGLKDPSTHGWWRWSSHWWAHSPRCTTRSELWKCWPSGSCWRCTDGSLEAARSPSSPSLRGAQPCGWWASELGVRGSHRWSGSQSGSRSPYPPLPPPSSAAACWSWLQNNVNKTRYSMKGKRGEHLVVCVQFCVHRPAILRHTLHSASFWFTSETMKSPYFIFGSARSTVGISREKSPLTVAFNDSVLLSALNDDFIWLFSNADLSITLSSFLHSMVKFS